MWLVAIALVSIIASLVVGRLLASAAAEQTNPRPVRGPSLQSDFLAGRLAMAANAARQRLESQAVHLN